MRRNSATLPPTRFRAWIQHDGAVGDRTLRGLAATQFEIGFSVAQYIDEKPYGASNLFMSGGLRFTLDAALFDIARIEVLKRPQARLYGAGAMGGLVKYVPNLTELDWFGVDILGGASQRSIGGISYNGSMTLNCPCRRQSGRKDQRLSGP